MASKRTTWVLGATLSLGAVAFGIGCAAETDGPLADEGLGESSHALTAEQLACEGYDATFAGKLSKAGLKRDGHSSQHRCYSYVKDHIAAAGSPVPQSLYSTTYGASAYQFTNWARNNPNDLKSLGFKEVTLGKDERPPKGSIIVWSRGQCGYSAVHGHIEVVVDDGGKACSDFCGKIPTDCGAPTVFMPVSADAPAPAPGATCAKTDAGAPDASRDAADGGADASRDAASDAVYKDSCSGKGDGWYCSQLVTYSAYQCKGQQIALGYQCASGQKCASSGPSGAAVVQNNVPACN